MTPPGSSGLRGFTARLDGGDPREAALLLRRFYRCAEDVLFPDAVIDKLIGDEVMALYLPDLTPGMSREDVPARMLDHAIELSRRVRYGSDAGPFAEMGVGIDVGEAFVGNIGHRALYDFTAVGDVVNTASRLQSHAAPGEVVLSARVVAGLAGRLARPSSCSSKASANRRPPIASLSRPDCRARRRGVLALRTSRSVDAAAALGQRDLPLWGGAPDPGRGRSGSGA